SGDELLKCGLVFKPPTLLLLYRRGGLLGVVRKRSVRLGAHLSAAEAEAKNGDAGANSTGAIAERLKQDKRHGDLICQLSQLQLERLLSILRDVTVNGLSKEQSLDKQRQMEQIDPLEDPNKVDEETLQRKKAAMQEQFEKHQLKPGDPGYIYDKEVDFSADAGTVEHCEWDSEDDQSGF
ncbi:hypothetical protein BOX15_Mlig002438g8, partial [Macrostomum lignano]